MDLVEGDVVVFLRIGMWIRAFHKSEANSDLGAKTDDCSGDVRIDKGGDGSMDIARV